MPNHPGAKPLSGVGGLNDPAVLAVATSALALVKSGARVGLGSGRASTAFIRALGQKVQEGFKVEGVAASETSAALARQLGIPLIELDEDVILDLTVDGADEVSPELDLIKGLGGALVRERIVTASSRRQVILVGAPKLVRGLGEHAPIPVEIIPLAQGYVTRELKALGLRPRIRVNKDKTVFKSDNGNYALDCAVPAPLSATEARKLEAQILALAGVVDTGLFLGTAERVLVGYEDGRVEVKSRG